MNARLQATLNLLALAVALVRGLGEFASLQIWRLRERITR